MCCLIPAAQSSNADTEPSGKMKGGATTCQIQQHCSSIFDPLSGTVNPSTPPEFASFILFGVYIPSDANVQDAQRMLADRILCVERTGPDSLVIVLGGNLSNELSEHKQLVKCSSREENPATRHTTCRACMSRCPSEPPESCTQAESQKVSGPVTSGVSGLGTGMFSGLLPVVWMSTQRL